MAVAVLHSPPPLPTPPPPSPPPSSPPTPPTPPSPPTPPPTPSPPLTLPRVRSCPGFPPPKSEADSELAHDGFARGADGATLLIRCTHRFPPRSDLWDTLRFVPPRRKHTARYGDRVLYGSFSDGESSCDTTCVYGTLPPTKANVKEWYLQSVKKESQDDINQQDTLAVKLKAGEDEPFIKVVDIEKNEKGPEGLLPSKLLDDTNESDTLTVKLKPDEDELLLKIVDVKNDEKEPGDCYHLSFWMTQMNQ